MLTNKQKMLLHVVPGKLGIDDEQRRTIQRTVGGFESAADRKATHAGFAAVMAFYEDRAGGTLEGYTPSYWRHSHERNEAGGGGQDRLVYLIRQQATQMGWSAADVEHFLSSKHCSSGLFGKLRQASNYWLSRCLDGMKAMAKRQANGRQQPEATA